MAPRNPLRAAAAALALAAATVLAPALPAAAKPQVTAFTLANGMEAVVIEDHRAPVVTHMVWYKVGAADEPPGRSGIAHLFEHLMFKGTDEIPDSAFSKIVAANGGQDNAFTSQDYTAYYQRIAADRLELVMKMEADRMADLVINDDHLRTERQVVIEERNQRTENNPRALFGEQFDAALYMNHPYGIPVIGWRHEIDALTLPDLHAFYDRWYAPNRAMLVVAGDVTPEEVRRLAEKHYGPIPPSDIGEAPRMRPSEPPQRAPRRLVMEDARVRQPAMSRSYLVAPRRTDQAQAAALLIASEVLGGGINGRIQQALTVQNRVAVSAGAWFGAGLRDYAEFGFWAAPAPGVSLQEAEDALDRTLAAFLASDGPTEAELARIKAGYRADLVYADDSQMGLARRYGAGRATGLTIEQIEAWGDVLQAVTAEDVMAALRAALDPNRSVTGWLRAPEAGTEAPGDAARDAGGARPSLATRG
ncbi:M16 family metallopeptidase [Rhodovulum sp. DZ06]|uniref:M16 family metallopeptidase n=1 Tax=Rhodovulum sp. DZ06 TaxID=3425126 RepID=UPI003D3306C2